MRIVIDLEWIQSSNGNLSAELEPIKQLTQAGSSQQLFVIVAGHKAVQLRRAVEEYLPREQILSWPTVELSQCRENADLNRALKELVIKSLRPDAVVIPVPEHQTRIDPSPLTESFIKMIPSFLIGLTGDHNASVFCYPINEWLPPAEWRSLVLDNALASDLLMSQDGTSLLQNIALIVDEFVPNLVLDNSPQRRLAYVSPLPPLKSGIADYSESLIPHLACHYQIDVFVPQDDIAPGWVKSNCRVLPLSDLYRCASDYERVLYHFGNNPQHADMFELLEAVPGVVVLHDFFLSGINWYREAHQIANQSLNRELYRAHGYLSVQERLRYGDKETVFKYPCSRSVIDNSVGMIVHSPNSLRLAEQWYQGSRGFKVIPLLRDVAPRKGQKDFRIKYSLHKEDIVVASFGFLGPTKQNHRLLEAWKMAGLDKSSHHKLYFVGDTEADEYGHSMRQKVESGVYGINITIVGWTEAEEYQEYLQLADVAVQLRTLSRGETSAAVLDCMNYGIATIVNANGSMADIPEDTVFMLPDEFEDLQLAEALKKLASEEPMRKQLGEAAAQLLHTEHEPSVCARQYWETIEEAYRYSPNLAQSVVNELTRQSLIPSTTHQQKILAAALSHIDSLGKPIKNLYVDISVVARDDFKTGIQRVVRAFLTELIKSPPVGYRIEPVFMEIIDEEWGYYHARDYTFDFIGAPTSYLPDEPVEFCAGDLFLGLDLAGGYVVNAARQGLFQRMMAVGVSTYFVVYDLIPIQFEGYYPDGFKKGHEDWLKVVAKSHGALCISLAVADELQVWCDLHKAEVADHFRIDHFHLGADIGSTAPSKGLPDNAVNILSRIRSSPSFLMVGTIEPRKGYRQVLEAFTLLWKQGADVNLVFVGKKGWLVDELINFIETHPQLGDRLLWLESISDEYLEEVYAACSCLLAASEGEGFGLPLIEAAQKKKPIIARNIPVFKEVAGGYAYYFNDKKEPQVISKAVTEWLQLYKNNQHPKSDNMPWLTWKQSTVLLSTKLTCA